MVGGWIEVAQNCDHWRVF